MWLQGEILDYNLRAVLFRLMTGLDDEISLGILNCEDSFLDQGIHCSLYPLLLKH